MRKRTSLVDFIKSESRLGEKDGEIIVNMTVRLQLEKFGLEGFHTIWKRRFPYISSKGVFHVTGKAVCGEEQFNYDKGRNIAETRAQRKAYLVAFRVFDMIQAELEDLYCEMKAVMWNCSEIANDCLTHIKELDK